MSREQYSVVDVFKLIIAGFVCLLWAAALTALVLPLIDIFGALEGSNRIAGIFFALMQDAISLACGYFFMEVYLELKTLIMPHPKLPAIDSLPYDGVVEETKTHFYDEFGDQAELDPRRRKRATAELLQQLKTTVLTSERLRLIEKWVVKRSKRTVVSKGEVDDILRLFPPDALVEAYIYEMFRPFLAKLLQQHRKKDALAGRTRGEARVRGPEYDDEHYEHYDEHYDGDDWHYDGDDENYEHFEDDADEASHFQMSLQIRATERMEMEEYIRSEAASIPLVDDGDASVARVSAVAPVAVV